MKSKAILACIVFAAFVAAGDLPAGPHVRISPQQAAKGNAPAQTQAQPGQQGQPNPYSDVRYVCPQCRKQIRRDPAKQSGFMGTCPYCGGKFLAF